MPKQIYTAGYQNFDRDQLGRFMQQTGGVLMDIRQSPFSRKPEWNRNRLAAQLGGKYIHLQAFGNVNYKNGLPIQINDYPAGLKVLVPIVDAQPVILLCACRNYNICHRHTIAEMLLRDGFDVCEWQGEVKPSESKQASFFDLLQGGKK